MSALTSPSEFSASETQVKHRAGVEILPIPPDIKEVRTSVFEILHSRPYCTIFEIILARIFVG